MLNICFRVFRIFYSNKDYDIEEQWGKEEELYVGCLVNILPQTQLYLRTMDAYFDLILFLLQINSGIIRSMLSKQIIGRLVSCLFRTQPNRDQLKEFTNDIQSFETTLKIRYDSNITDDPRQDSPRDFTNPNLSNLTKFYSLLWEFIKHSILPSREKHKKFLYHKQGIDYKLTLNEAKLFNFDVVKIEHLFKSIDPDDKKTIKIICRIVAFSAFGSENVSNAAKEYLEKLVYEVDTDRNLQIYFHLIKTLIKLDDDQQLDRVIFAKALL